MSCSAVDRSVLPIELHYLWYVTTSHMHCHKSKIPGSPQWISVKERKETASIRDSLQVLFCATQEKNKVKMILVRFQTGFWKSWLGEHLLQARILYLSGKVGRITQIA